MHHTGEMSQVKLIVRRGQSFCIRLKFKDSFDPKVNNLKFTASTGKHADETRGTKSVFGIPDFVKRSAEAKVVWKAEIIRKESTDPKQNESDPEKDSVFITITPPADAPVGLYTLSLNYSGEDKNLGPLALLFNAWCPEDSVYMEKAKAREEYVMNEHGVIYKGSSNYIFPTSWDYGQFEEDMVKIVFGLLHVNPHHISDPVEEEGAWGDPIHVGRVISAMINSEGDRGVLEGRWGGPYIGGFCPSHWSGSYAILKRWLNIGCHPVKYGQCWVFAGVMCSVMRALGVPCRVVTNFSSAHDTDCNLIIDEYHADYGVEERYSDDSVWNFHVWVECWMKRPDLPAGFDGWQVLDPTPQELSGGRYQCGPASVKAILNGHTDQDYDIPFVFAEVNADCIDWLVKADGSKTEIWSDTKRVGQNISTKSIGLDKRKNITCHYKHKEGSEKERTVYKFATTRDYSPNDGETDSEESAAEEEEIPEEEEKPDETEKPAPELPEITMKFEEDSELVNGKDVKLTLVLHSEATEPRQLSVNISVNAKAYTGSGHCRIQSELMEKKLHPGKDLRIPVVVPFSKYWGPMLDFDVMKVCAIASDTREGAKGYLAELDVVLLDPDIVVKVLNEAKRFRRMYLEISFENPVPETLKKCSFTLSGSGLLAMEHDFSVPDIGPKRRLRVKLYFFPYKVGKKTLVVDFNCSCFRDIKKSITIDIQ